MGIFDFHKPKDIRYVSKEALKANLQKQDEALANILGVIKKNSLTDTNQRCLEYFFYTNTYGKAKLLAEELQKKEYSAAYRESG